MQDPGVLREPIGVITQTAVAKRDVEASIRPKDDVAAPVVGQGLWNLQKYTFRFRQGIRGGILRGTHLADHRAAGVVLGVAEVKQPVFGEAGMKGDAVHAFLEKQDAFHFCTKIEKGAPLAAAIEPHGTEFTALHGDHLLAAGIGQRC